MAAKPQAKRHTHHGQVSLQNISKDYAGRDLFGIFLGDSWRHPAGHPSVRTARSESTLLKLIAGVSEPDSGKVSLSTGARLGYVAQEMEKPISA